MTDNDNVTTQEDLLNTETDDLEVTTNEVTDDELENTDNETSFSFEEVNSWSDEEFIEYMNSGTVPERSKNNAINKSSSNKTSDDDESSESVSDIRNNKTNKKPDTEHESNTEQSKQEAKKGNKENTEEINYKEVYGNIFKPFKANGKEITPRNAEDVISLMQMGANYTKKMQELAPMRKTFESLNKANIEEKDLNFLIDLHKGDKEAIKELLKKHKVDPMDIDLDDTKYVPNKKNIATDTELMFSGIVQEIGETNFSKIKDILASKWDVVSKQEMFKDTSLFYKLNEEIELGRFDEVQARLELEKTFGRYKGVPDIIAYSQIVTKMAEENKASNNSTNKPSNKSNKNIPDKKEATPTRSNRSDKSLPNVAPKDIFSMSEEDFKRLGGLV